MSLFQFRKKKSKKQIFDSEPSFESLGVPKAKRRDFIGVIVLVALNVERMSNTSQNYK